MKNKTSVILVFLVSLLSLVLVFVFVINNSEKRSKSMVAIPTIKPEEEKPKGIMMLIEYEDDLTGLINMVSQLDERNIYSLLSASPDFVEKNCETVKTLMEHKMEIVSQNPAGSFWDVPFEEQLTAIKEAKEKIEACTGKPLRVVSSRYFASDENTVKVAEQLSIPYVLARGVEGTDALVFQPAEYPSVKILSVSNIPSIEFKYGSLCDYSYWVREGSPEDMKKELLAGSNNRKITPVSHTNIGGLKARWNQMWMEFFDQATVNWLPLDQYASIVDMKYPMWKIPINKNAPYTPEKRPEIPYDEEKDLKNPCSVGELRPETKINGYDVRMEDGIVMFHNGKGSMCLEAMEFLASIDYPNRQVLNTEADFTDQLGEMRQKFEKSEGVAEDFSYYPIIFVGKKAFSGFDESIKVEIEKELGI